jgi:ATP-dependent Lhr-like helicase
VRDFAPADLDALMASGDLVWVGAGPLGGTDGRVRLLFRHQAAALVDAVDADDLPRGPLHDSIRAVLVQRGALFWPDVLAACGGGATVDEVLTALWDLVWSGEVTNDTMAPLRGLLRVSSGRRRSARARPRPGQLRVSGPPSAAGRWSLTAALLEPRPSPTESAHLRASVLVERHGVLTREAALAEGVRGGFASVYPVLRALEDRGQVRRGYFVAGLGGAQFASLGAIDRLREHRDPPEAPAGVALAAADPAQPYGATLPWPESSGRPARSAGAYVVVVDGTPALFLERGGRSLATFASTVDTAESWIEPLQGLVKDGRLRSIELARIDGEPAASSPIAEVLLGHGFTQGYRGLTFRA